MLLLGNNTIRLTLKTDPNKIDEEPIWLIFDMTPYLISGNEMSATNSSSDCARLSLEPQQRHENVKKPCNRVKRETIAEKRHIIICLFGCTREEHANPTRSLSKCRPNSKKLSSNTGAEIWTWRRSDQFNIDNYLSVRAFMLQIPIAKEPMH